MDTSRWLKAKSGSHTPLKGLGTFLMIFLAGSSEDNFLQVRPHVWTLVLSFMKAELDRPRISKFCIFDASD